MSDFTAQIHGAGEQYLTTLATIQERFVEAVTAFVKQTPNTPTTPDVPGLPTPGEITAASFDFADRLLTQNRAHADQLLAALAPASV